MITNNRNATLRFNKEQLGAKLSFFWSEEHSLIVAIIRDADDKIMAACPQTYEAFTELYTTFMSQVSS